ncbi:calmodulin-binding transcription activator isoform X5 [Choristoneura fumiferana]|uniref:calmodulin-binding transcription activator isoform X5 n=1 Tax=Choristoneura fumiferana TaxID=7141 RepID=UPI003D15E93F
MYDYNVLPGQLGPLPPAGPCAVAPSRVALAAYGRHAYAGAYHARAPAVPLNANGEPIKLPENLESLPRAEHFAAQRHRWNTNEEIAAILISFDKHSEWQSKEVKIRPKSGSMLLYSRKKVRYRRDGYCWKKRKDGKTTREDHMKLKVQGTECIYGCYVHSAILPTFHRRCYWLLQNPDIVLVHYLNVPYPDDNKLATVAPSLALWADKKEWTKDELVSQLKPMFFSEDEPDINSELEITGKMFQTTETVEAIVGQLMEKQRAARAAALARQLECGCPDSTCQDSRTCAHPLRRIQSAKAPASDHHVSSTTGPSTRPMSHPPRQYTREHRSTQPTHSASPLLLSLGQIQGGGGLLILNGAGNNNQQHSSLVSPLSVTSFVCEEPRDRYRHQYKPTFVLKREVPDSQPSSCIRNTESSTFEVEPPVEEKVNVEIFDRKIKMEPRSRNQMIASAPATPSRYPDLVERLESKILTDNCDDTLVLLGTDGHLGPSSAFFDETLELSHEDIQKTLSANMPTCELDRSGVRVTETANVMVSGIDTMDFIESCEAVASPTHVVDDNVFVNLDAFDMLDFPELEVLDPSTISTHHLPIRGKSPPTEETNEKMQVECGSEGALSITDYCPEWAYPEGGVKVLVAGPWTDTSDQYTVLFDNFPVPSILVQNGLLRCYCPAHEAGLAALQVARGGRVVSDTVVFEYKAGPTAAPSPASAPLPSLDFRRFSLLQRLQRLHGRLQIKIEPMEDSNQIEDVQLYSNPKFEERLVSFCRNLSTRSAGNSEGFTTEPGEEGSTILHLSAALGFTKLTTVLLRWKQDDTSLALEKEVNLGARDCDNCTPLMVASAAGHVETAIVLARWSAGTLCEAGARQAAASARRAGHSRLATLLDRIHPPTRDGVFLRPDSLSQKGRAGSLESNLVKRPSIDSGINMADAFRSSSAIDKPDSKSNARWERSMSLPLDSDNSEDSLLDSKIGRRMDLALWEQDDRVFTLAEQIIAAMPERIKNESSSLLSGCGLDNSGGNGEDTLMVPLLDDTTTFSSDFSFEFCDNTYRTYCGGSTPCSSGSVSPGSALSPPPPSPRAPSLPSAPSATLQEFLNATTHFSSLTLNDREQRELYSAAITIQKAYRQYRGRQLQRRAAAAAITIQNCYRRYKQFAYLKQMHCAATVIQRGYRSHRERRLAVHQSNATIKRTYSQRRQNQAARKIQQFMRQSKIKLQNARAENGKVVLRSPDAHQSFLQHTTNIRTPNRVINYLAPQSPMDADDDLLLELLFKM